MEKKQDIQKVGGGKIPRCLLVPLFASTLMMKSMIKSLATKEGGMIEEEDVEAGDVPGKSDETDPEEEKLASKSRLWELR